MELSIAGTKITKLDGLGEHAILASLNISACELEGLSDLTPLQALPKLRRIALADTSIAGGEEYRVEVIIRLPNLTHIDGVAIKLDERKAAQQLAADRKEEEEKAAAAAAEANGAAEGEEEDA